MKTRLHGHWLLPSGQDFTRLTPSLVQLLPEREDASVRMQQLAAVGALR